MLGLTLNQAAYSAEIIRGGILSVDQGQLEAAAALGIPAWRRSTRIVLPQAMRAILPTAFNEIIGLVKGTSIVYVLAYSELFYTVQVIYNRTQQVLPLLLVATLWYVVITSVLSVFQYYIERHYSKGAVRTPAADAAAEGPQVLRHPRRGTNRKEPLTLPDAQPPQPTLPRPAATRGLVEITNVRKSFGATEVLKGITLTVEPGGVAVIVGPSGSGKSTLLRTINHLEKVDGGHIAIDGDAGGLRGPRASGCTSCARRRS